MERNIMTVAKLISWLEHCDPQALVLVPHAPGEELYPVQRLVLAETTWQNREGWRESGWALCVE